LRRGSPAFEAHVPYFRGAYPLLSRHACPTFWADFLWETPPSKPVTRGSLTDHLRVEIHKRCLAFVSPSPQDPGTWPHYTGRGILGTSDTVPLKGFQRALELGEVSDGGVGPCEKWGRIDLLDLFGHQILKYDALGVLSKNGCPPWPYLLGAASHGRST
jgi:hypothetical protein